MERDEAALPDVLALLAREAMCGRHPPASAARMVDLWRPELEPRVGALLDDLEAECGDQQSFATLNLVNPHFLFRQGADLCKILATGNALLADSEHGIEYPRRRVRHRGFAVRHEQGRDQP